MRCAIAISDRVPHPPPIAMAACAAPSSTVGPALRDGDGIPIEQRSADEVKTVAGRPVAPPTVAVLNPAFDVTPARYVTGYLTDRGLRKPPFGAD